MFAFFNKYDLVLKVSVKYENNCGFKKFIKDKIYSFKIIISRGKYFFASTK